MDAPLKRFLFYSHIVATLASLVAGPGEHMGTVGIGLKQKGLDHKMASDTCQDISASYEAILFLILTLLSYCFDTPKFTITKKWIQKLFH